MRALLERQYGIVGVSVRIGVDRGDIRLQVAQGSGVVGEMRVAGQFGAHPRGRAVDETDDLEAGVTVIGEGMAAAHIAETRDEHAQRHLTAPASGAISA